jgi:hypothetical protein
MKTVMKVTRTTTGMMNWSCRDVPQKRHQNISTKDTTLHRSAKGGIGYIYPRELYTLGRKVMRQDIANPTIDDGNQALVFQPNVWFALPTLSVVPSSRSHWEKFERQPMILRNRQNPPYKIVVDDLEGPVEILC